MKHLITLIALIGITFSAKGAEFVKCSDADLQVLEMANSASNFSIPELVQTDILPKSTTCMVQKPRFVHPAVCGATIVMIDTYKIETTERGSFEIVVDNSQLSCYEILRLPTITSLKYELKPRVVPLNEKL